MRLLVFVMLFLVPGVLMASSPESYKIKKVVLDAGHGGRDSGAKGLKADEKDITLAVALKVGEYINDYFSDVEVIYTRTEDVFVPLDERSRIANESGADIFISIHCNANPSKSPYGTETFVMGLHRSKDNLDVAMRENAVITYEEDYKSTYEGYDPNSAESFIVFNLMQHSFLEQSLNMASLIQNQFRERARRRDRGVKQAGFIVLWRASMPSVLVELGFLSNAKEEQYLISSDGQTYLASSIFRAFRDYKERVELRSTFTAESHFDETINQLDDPDAPRVTSKWMPKDPKYKAVSFSDGVQYMVQITASSNRIPTNSPFFKSLNEVEELATDGLYKYLVGKKSSYAESYKFCQEIRELFPDAFVVAFKDGEPISLDKARKLTSN
ncbi:MAG: N-acetylmuramoyl-L-alanine amidase [Bacteroidales bacterium]